jgi:hypothetical protein
MNDIALNVRELSEKAKTAVDVASLGELRAAPLPAEGKSFRVNGVIYVWAGTDKSSDDGVSSIRPTSVAPQSPGRYRRATLTFPFIRR